MWDGISLEKFQNSFFGETRSQVQARSKMVFWDGGETRSRVQARSKMVFWDGGETRSRVQARSNVTFGNILDTLG